MNNDEKILSLLEQLTSDVSSMKSDIADLKAGQAKLETELHTVKEDGQITRNIVTRMEEDHGKRLGVLFDGYKQNYDMLQRLEKKVAAGDEVILRRVLPRK